MKLVATQLPNTIAAPRRCLALAGLLALGAVLARAQDVSPETTTNHPAADAPAGEAARPHGRSYEDFKLITDRNIFDPSRRARSRRPEAERPPEPKIDIVALTGTLSYEKGTFAFFDSNASEFRQTAKVGDTVAGYTLKNIEQSKVALERESQLLELKVGQQLRRQDEGAWEITSGESVNHGGGSSRGNARRASGSSSGRSFSRSNSRSFDPSSTEAADGEVEESNQDTNEPAATLTDGSGEGPSDALKRLLEQRRKEQEQ